MTDTLGVVTKTEGLPRGYSWGIGSVVSYKAPDLGQQARNLASQWASRNKALKRYDDLLAMEDENETKGLESMVANNAKTLFSLSHFMVATSVPQRTVAIGGAGPRERRRAGLSERAAESMWRAVNEDRLLNGDETWQYAMAYWMCLYGWYATLATTVICELGKPCFLAVPYDPSECYPEYGDPYYGMRQFARIYPTTLADAREKAQRYGMYREGAFRGEDSLTVMITDYWKRVGSEVMNCIIMAGGGSDYMYLKEPEVLPLARIPIMCGPVGGTPSRSYQKKWQSYPGSVLAENERVYKDFNKWISFLAQLVREQAQAPYLAKSLHVEKEEIQPAEWRDTGAVIETDDPEAALERVNIGPAPLDVFRLLQMVSSMEQRGGFPESAYGNLMFELSGFGISQLLQAAERRIGPQTNKLMFLDAYVSDQWLKDFRDNEFPALEISGFEGGNPRKSFIEDFRPQDVPQKYRLSTNIPIRMGNDMMSRMAVLRQAIPTEQLLDIYTGLDEILQMQDPTLIMDRISEDRTRTMTEPFKVAMNLKMQAQDIRATRKPGAEEVARMLEQVIEQVLTQQQQAQGAQARPGVRPEAMPPEAQGVSPDQVRSQLRMGPPPNQPRGQQLGA